MENLLKILYIGRSTEGIIELRTHSDVSLIHKSNMLEAANYLKSENKPDPDVVISEIYISGGDGLEMHNWIRERPEFDRIAFILISYEFKVELFNTALTNRIDDYFVLPFPSAESIVSRIRFIVEFRHKYSLITYVDKNQDIKYDFV